MHDPDELPLRLRYPLPEAVSYDSRSNTLCSRLAGGHVQAHEARTLWPSAAALEPVGLRKVSQQLRLTGEHQYAKLDEGVLVSYIDGTVRAHPQPACEGRGC